jgi:hypothetical protein
MKEERICLILLLRNIVVKVFVTQEIVIHSPHAYTAITRVYKRRKPNYQRAGETVCHSQERAQLLTFLSHHVPILTNCHISMCHLRSVLGNEAMKPLQMTRQLNRDIPFQSTCVKVTYLATENKIISQRRTTEISLLIASYLISLQTAKYIKSYSISEESIKPCFIDACNEVLGKSTANKMESVPLASDRVERQKINIHKIPKLFELQIDKSIDTQNNSVLLMSLRCISRNQSDMEEDM